MGSFWTALKLLTLFPWPRTVTPTPEEIGSSASFFPLVGFSLGLILAFLNRILEPYLESEILGVVLVTLLILMTRALPLAGLGDTFDRLGAKTGGQGGFKGIEESGIGIFGLLAILVVVALKFRSIEVMGEARNLGLLLAPLLGRWAMVVLAYGSESVREEMGRIMVGHVRGWHLFLATLLTLILVIIFASRLGLWIALWISLFTLLSRNYLHRRLGGVTGGALGAIGEMSEAFALVLFASLQ